MEAYNRPLQEDLETTETLRMLDQPHLGQKILNAAREYVAAEFMRKPDSPIGYYGEAMISTALGMPLEAANHFRKSLQAEPGNLAARFQLALNYYRRGMNAEALAELEKIAAHQPDFPDLSMRMASIKALSEACQRHADVANYRPIFLLAPVARCGSTFLQRLVNSSGKVAIFGENQNISERLPESVEEASFRLAGSQASLPGSGDDYFELMLHHFYGSIDFYQKTGEKAGRTWGIKEPYSGQMGVLRNLLPHAKFVFLYRNLFDVARSYKARGWFYSKFSVIELAHDWQEQIRKALLCGDHNIMVIRYEDLVSSASDVWVDQLEGFLGIAGIRREKFRIKVNNPGKSYLPPKELTDEERQLLNDHASIMLDRLNYS